MTTKLKEFGLEEFIGGPVQSEEGTVISGIQRHPTN